MEKLAVIDFLMIPPKGHFFGELSSFIKSPTMTLLRALGPENAVWYCGGPLAEQNPEALAELRSLGLEVVVDDYRRAEEHKYYLVVTSFHDSYPQGSPAPAFIEGIDAREGRLIFVCDLHKDFYLPTDRCLSRSHILYSTEHLMFKYTGEGRYIVDGQGHPLVSRAPSGLEGATCGSLSVPQSTLDLLARPRAEVREELSRRMNWSFRPDKPLVLYIPQHYNERAATDRGLRRLTGEVDLIIKHAAWEDPARPYAGCYCGLTGPHIYNSRGEVSINLLRAAADLTVVEFYAGSFLTNILLGLRSIPVHTQNFFASVPQDLELSYTLMFRDVSRLQVVAGQYIPPLNIEATEMILERIHNQDYWERWDRDIKIVQKEIFGHYWIGDEAVDRTVAAIRRILERGSLAPDQVTRDRFRLGQAGINRHYNIIL